MPGDRLPAPGRLRVVQALLNTINLDTGQDAIDTREGLSAWLAEFGLAEASEPVAPAGVDGARELREALRLLVRRNGEPGTDIGDAPDVVERTARAGRLTARIDPPGPRLVPTAPGVPGALAAVAAAAFEAMLDGSWHRLRACRRCHWAHYDRSRNLSARWCSMRYCGNRTKTRAYRSRRGGDAC